MVVRLPAPPGEFMAAEARRWGRLARIPVGLTGLTEPGQPTCRSTPTFYRWASVWFGGPAEGPLRPWRPLQALPRSHRSSHGDSLNREHRISGFRKSMTSL